MAEAPLMVSGETRLRASIHHLLLGGVLASALLMAAGLLVSPWARPLGMASMRAGILLLILTPVLRVVRLAAGYGRARDWPFFWASLGVLGLLAAGIALSL